jgi:hypothetical protein
MAADARYSGSQQTTATPTGRTAQPRPAASRRKVLVQRGQFQLAKAELLEQAPLTTNVTRSNAMAAAIAAAARVRAGGRY